MVNASQFLKHAMPTMLSNLTNNNVISANHVIQERLFLETDALCLNSAHAIKP